MRAVDRCKEHFQGDRCRAQEDHSEGHVGTFQSWTGDGDNKERTAKTERKAPKRNRTINRFVRSFDERFTKVPRAQLYKALDNAISHLRGK